jgi:steroid 5-alpha reductase family enzyme
MAADGGREHRAGRARTIGFAIVALTYVAAGLAAWILSIVIDGHHPLTVTWWADLAATVVVFAATMAVGNASLYDPYWSVAPAVIVLAWVVTAGSVTTVRPVLVAGLVLIWAIRLTANWARSWRGLSHEDWRYVQIRAETRGRWPWWLVSLAGIQVLPTVVVFAGMLAVWPAVTVRDRPLGVLDGAAVLVTAGAIAVETIADRQLHRFTADPAHRSRAMDRGLWRYSRHPNYLGEIGFWWGLWLFALASAPDWWWTVVGPVTMLLLFTFVSVPLMDRRSLARRPEYAEHLRRVPALLPLPRRRKDPSRV